MLGKTNMDEFAMGSSNENSAYGPVLNPWDRERVPGGSSGGSAAAVAGGLAPCAIGTDTGGSIRQPAALCGIVGLKPTYGAISRYGMIAFASSLDQCGPLTRDVTDAALLLAAMQGRDPCDSTSVGIEGGVEAPSREDLQGPALRRAGRARRRRDRGRACARSSRRRWSGSRSSAARSPRCALPHAEHGISAYYVIAPAEASSNLARYDGVRYGMRGRGRRPDRDVRGDARARASAPRSSGGSCSAPTRSPPATTRPTTARPRRCARRSPRTSPPPSPSVDFVVTPTSPSVAFGLGEKTDDPLAMYLNDFFTVPMSLAGIPAISIPAGLAEPEGGGPAAAGRLPDRRARPSPSRSCSRPPSRSSRRSASTPGPREAEPMAELEAVIGLEIHVQLSTRTKMFCGCELSFGDEPNVHTCPVCLAHPGVLPVPNEEAIRYALKIGAGARLRGRAALDLPPQELLLSRQPEGATRSASTTSRSAGGGRLGDVRIHRAHLEEDAAKMIHVGESGRIHGSGASLVDFNRGGTPLVEIVTEPDLRSAAEAARLGAAAARDGPPARRLRRQHGGGQPAGRRQRLGAPGRQRGAGHEDRAEEHEQLPLPRARDRGRAGAPARADRGGRGRSSRRRSTSTPATATLTSLRSKEEAHDYRYFPEPDLVPLAPTEEMLREARESLPELPAARIERYEGELGLAAETSPRCSPPTRRPPPTSSGSAARPTASSRRSSPTG